MRRPRLPAGVALLALLLQGCAYYNGMYYARRYSRQAERAEREGRISTALDGWRRAAVHAESLVAHHPRSRWADDARLVRGRALVHLEVWNDAAVVLAEAVRDAGNDEQRLEAWLYLGRANLGIRRYAEAIRAFDSAGASGDERRRASALLYRGRVAMAMGRPAEAMVDFRASGAREARFDRAGAALAMGDAPLAAAIADSLGNLPFLESRWLSFLDSLGRAGYRDRAGQVVDMLVARRDVPLGGKGRLLLLDGERWLRAGEDSAAAGRFRAVARLVPDSIEARAAAVRLARVRLRGAANLEQLFAPRELLGAIANIGGTPGQEAQDLLGVLTRITVLTEVTEAADAWWFLRAEMLRDSLGATVMAGDAFAEMGARFPDSPWTPKGLLAAVGAGHPAADSLLALMRTRYPDSPYTRIAMGAGDDPDRYAALEDSMRVALGGTAPAAAVAPVAEAAVGEWDDEGVSNRRDPLPEPPARPAPRQLPGRPGLPTQPAPPPATPRVIP